jgi:succinoglycan biosynthesis transport protein ExoP
MANAIPDRALAALLSFEDEEDNKIFAENALPTLKERVELFLRAKYGEDRIFTASERTAARARILDAIANNSATEVNGQVRTDLGDHTAAVIVLPDGRRQSPSGLQEDIEAPAACIRYSEEEAVRLSLPAAVIEYLRKASEELMKSIVAPLMSNLQLNPLGYARILAKHRYVIASIVVTAVVLGAVTTLMMKTPLYTSTVRVQIDHEALKVVEKGNVTAFDGGGREFMRTQFALLQSRTMAERVASALKLGDDDGFFRSCDFSIFRFFKKLISSAPAAVEMGSQSVSRQAAAVGIVMGNRAVKPVSESRLVDISYSDPDPARAQRIADAYANAFIASNLDKRFEANSYAKVFLEDQLATLKLRLEASRKALLAFGEKQEVVETTDKAAVAEHNLAAANATLAAVVADRIKNEQLWKQLQAATALNLPQISTNPAIVALRDKRSALAAEYQDKLQTFKPDYPAMVQLTSQIDEIDRQLATEVKTLKESCKAAYDISVKQEAEIKKRIETLKQDVLDLQNRGIEYNVKKREVDTNQAFYNGLLERYKEVDVAGGVGANNVFIVDRATLPGAPSSPNLSGALMTSLAFGIAGALGVAFMLGRLDDTMQSFEELERDPRHPTLGIIPRMHVD